MTWLYSIAILFGSCLLFLVQPMCAKMLLPLLGGTPAVWNTCMVFFQADLLTGYAYAHLLPNRIGTGRHAILHTILLGAVFFMLPIDLPGEVRDDWHPVLWLLASLAMSAGLPFVLLAAGAPLLQTWFASRSNHDPYFLYAASNLGSFLALGLFPLALEPYFSLSEQAAIWKYGYLALVVLTALCVPWRNRQPIAAEISTTSPAPTWRQRGRWIVLALIPSSLLLSVTSHLTTDIAAIPLLWLIPLALYLLTFMIVFARKEMVSPALLKRWLPLVVIVTLLVMLLEATEPLGVVLAVHLVGFFWLALVCHGELARTRPAPQRLSDFYLCLAVGGVLGGVLNALVAPLVFSAYIEYPLMIALVCGFGLEHGTNPARRDWLWAVGIGGGTVLVILTLQSEPFRVLAIGKAGVVLMIGLPLLVCYLQQKQAARFALCIFAVVCAGSLLHGPHGATVHRERSYYGIHRVTKMGPFHRLTHGNIAHGQQNFDTDQPNLGREPLNYYSKEGPIGDVFTAFQGDARLNRVGVVGLGTGSLAAYSRRGQIWTFFEIDPSVVRIAKNPKLFTFLSDAEGIIHVETGDGRLQLKKSDEKFGLLVIDAFGSDAIPLHLLTRQALALYLDRLEPNGLLAFHVSNNYVDLEPPIANLAADAKPACTAYIRNHRLLGADEKREGKMESDWIVVARRPDDLVPLLQTGRWRPALPNPAHRVWTDDYSNLLQVFRWR